ncbi:inactive serine/threonine-protein kinase PLK5-like [Parus major]|uniref:inactive serine/threonine-protein kinase PLK5-like n=1 Tax=Parus major TaxID=9157 RepID=UPI00077140D4|nr:inactive serine/threonine-protein kinase PLK5-like [Parus major]
MVPRSAGAEPPPGWYLRDRDSGAFYKRGRLLGEGTFGRCYQVTEVTSGRLYAAKVIPRARLATAAIADRVERELELQRHLRHRHIVRLHGHFTDRGHLCLLLELCSRGGFTPQALPPRACHSVPIFVGQEPLRRILRCWRGCGCVPVTPGGGRAPPQST